ADGGPHPPDPRSPDNGRGGRIFCVCAAMGFRLTRGGAGVWAAGGRVECAPSPVIGRGGRGV
ncbi:MAG: hypothetical protein AVDCRST_MAG68-2527, partial [uncultured Gemmatimonadetes bacterium]